MESALYLIPCTLGDTPLEQVLPQFNHDIILGIKYFIVENIRTARRFLSKVDSSIDISSLTFYELSEHTDVKDIGHYLDPLEKQKLPMGVISEAGCPAVADPGAAVVAIAQKHKLRVIPLAGPSSIIMAVMASGFNGQSFSFNGYLPAKPAERAAKLRQLENRVYKEDQTQLFIEAPYRNAHMIETITQTLRPDTHLCIAAGITTAEEYIHTQTIAAWRNTKIPDLGKVPAMFLIYK